MAKKVWQSFDFLSTSRITNLPAPIQDAEAATKLYVDSAISGINWQSYVDTAIDSAIEGLKWKDSVRAATSEDINIPNPGTTSIGGVSGISIGDRILLFGQSNTTENGIYIFNGSSNPLVRALDANNFAELEQAVVSVEEGTYANSSFRQTNLAGVIGVTAVVFTNFGTTTPSATETVAGISEIATQAEVDTGVNTTNFVTPATLSSWSGRIKKYASTIGNNSDTSYTITHNLNTFDVQISVFNSIAPYDDIIVETYRVSANSINVTFDSPPGVNAFRVVVTG